MEKHPLHLKNPELQTSPEVERAVKRREWQTGEKVPNDPRERIGAYMDRLERIFLNPDKRKRERNLAMVRNGDGLELNYRYLAGLGYYWDREFVFRLRKSES